MITDVIPGLDGKFEITTDKSRSRKDSVQCKIFAYELNKYLAFEWIGPDEISTKNDSNLKIRVTVYFLPINMCPKKKIQYTELNFVLTCCYEPEGVETMKTWFENTWTNAFENLIVHVNEVFNN